MHSKPETKWEGKVSTTIKKASADQIWPFIKDYFNIAKWIPNLTSSHGIHGINGEVGCIRHCANEVPNQPKTWANERLTSIDSNEKYLTYKILENNMGYTFSVLKMKVTPLGASCESGCVLDWSFVCDPVEGLSVEKILSNLGPVVKKFGENMENDVLNKPKPETKWEGKVSTTIEKASADQIWPFIKDYFNIAKWIPNLTSSHGIHGVNGEVGCIRHCANEVPNQPKTLANERLTSIDSNEKYLTYKILENNMGYTYSVLKMKVTPLGASCESGCVLDWSFVCDPVEGLTVEKILSNLGPVVKKFGENMEKDVLKKK